MHLQSHTDPYQTLLSLLTTEWEQARADLPTLEESLLTLGNYDSRMDFIKKIAPSVAVVSIVGGVSSRWDASLSDPEGAKLAAQYGIIAGKSRFLTKVPNLLPRAMIDQPTLSILEYNLLSFLPFLIASDGKALGSHCIIYGKDEDRQEIEDITTKFGFTQTQIVKQAVYPGRKKPAGHADALTQHLDTFKNSTYVLTHFGGDVISFSTVYLSLLALDVVRQHHEHIGLILPTAAMEQPPYPVFVDDAGLPRRFGHAKLFGDTSLQRTEQQLHQGGSNVSIRAYVTEDLVQALRTLAPAFADKEEFALDHVDTYFADRDEARQFAIARPEEITGAAKTVTKIPTFLKNLEIILHENRMI